MPTRVGAYWRLAQDPPDRIARFQPASADTLRVRMRVSGGNVDEPEARGEVEVALVPGIGPVRYKRQQTEKGAHADERTRTVVLRLVED